MNIANKNLVCRDCHQEFVWTVGEQNFFREKGLQNIPARCDACREVRRRKDLPPSAQGAKSGGPVRTKVVCANCGLETTVPFLPRMGKPVYCSSCYIENKSAVVSARPVHTARDARKP